jgi:hypothetical protein
VNPAGEGAAPAPSLAERLQIREQHGWTLCASSVWAVSGSELNTALTELNRPALQFTTSDGDRWYLTVHGGPDGPASFCHEFSIHAHAPDPADDERRVAEWTRRSEPEPVDPELAFLEEPPAPPPERPPSPFDEIAQELAARGAALPGDFLDALARLPYSAAVERYRRWHAEHVSQALTRAGIPHDPAALSEVLLWENSGENEYAGDLGNLPRLLRVLGIVGVGDEEHTPASATATSAPQPAPAPLHPPTPRRRPTRPRRPRPRMASTACSPSSPRSRSKLCKAGP